MAPTHGAERCVEKNQILIHNPRSALRFASQPIGRANGRPSQLRRCAFPRPGQHETSSRRSTTWFTWPCIPGHQHISFPAASPSSRTCAGRSGCGPSMRLISTDGPPGSIETDANKADGIPKRFRPLFLLRWRRGGMRTRLPGASHTQLELGCCKGVSFATVEFCLLGWHL